MCKEYQNLRGNLSQTHSLLQVRWSDMTDAERDFVNNLVQASLCGIIRNLEVPLYIQDGILETETDKEEVEKDGSIFLAHICNDACLVRNSDGTFCCRKIDNLRVSQDNTIHMFKPLPKNYSVQCLKH